MYIGRAFLSFIKLAYYLSAVIITFYGIWTMFLIQHIYWLPILYGVAMLITYLLYKEDKYAAKNRMWRISESSLHFFELLGGWVSGYWAQIRLRHKTRKVSYQIVFWFIVTLHCVFWISIIFPDTEWLNFIPSTINEYLPNDWQILNKEASPDGYIRWEKSN